MANSTRLILIHLFGILAFLSIPVFFSPDFNTETNLFLIQGFKRNFVSYVLLLVFFYMNYYYFIPKYYFTKRTFLYFAFVLFSFALIAAAPHLLFTHGPRGFHSMNGQMGPPPMMLPNGNMPPHNHMGRVFFMFAEGSSIFQFLLILTFSFLLRVNNQLSEMHSEKLKAEVSYLKAQINPHFLFNTLNSLYALTIQKSDAAPDAVVKLSNMMRYVVTESTNDLVPLEKEINYISDYVDMQRLRISDESNLDYSIIGNPKGKSIAPLVIIPFIENAFKYGINAEEDWHIAIVLEIVENDFILEVKNNKVPVNFPEEHMTEQGIENTEKRLGFIYPGKHTLEIIDEKETFRVHLKVNLS
ncbi:MAG TPA: histidine kinase [Flavobacterium sp.]|nr:histidine kinase [Flavobacterium sp.]